MSHKLKYFCMHADMILRLAIKRLSLYYQERRESLRVSTELVMEKTYIIEGFLQLIRRNAILFHYSGDSIFYLLSKDHI